MTITMRVQQHRHKQKISPHKALLMQTNYARFMIFLSSVNNCFQTPLNEQFRPKEGRLFNSEQQGYVAISLNEELRYQVHAGGCIIERDEMSKP